MLYVTIFVIVNPTNFENYLTRTDFTQSGRSGLVSKLTLNAPHKGERLRESSGFRFRSFYFHDLIFNIIYIINYYYYLYIILYMLYEKSIILTRHITGLDQADFGLLGDETVLILYDT